MAIAYWQLSRIHALRLSPREALRYGERCLALCQNEHVAPFFVLAYAYESLARAEALASNSEKKMAYISQAESTAASLLDANMQQRLRDDLASIP